MDDSAKYRQIRDLFDEAVEMPAEQRAEFLRVRCPDGAVRASVEALLSSHDGAGEFLSRAAPAMEIERGGVGDHFVGATLGSFRITGVLGAGGMGAVYRAEQHHPRRTVALKVIRGGWSTPSMRQRFALEAAALGRLRHAGIAQIFEAGSASGPDGRETPFFAMELVEGPALTAYAAEKQLSVRGRLALFALICDAAHHAHQKGIIHRDLKPGNILVEEAPGCESATESGTGSATVAQPKILDFGIARLTDSDVAVTTIRTDPGQIVGTLAYMSPEQVRGEIDRVDIRSDVYALGVVLYELLSGRLPHAVRGKSMPDAARLIADEEPALLGTIERGLRGDIETIVQKAMAKEPERRYSSAAELGADVRRFLADLPIVASPATAGYRLRKFATRNKGLVGGVAAAVVLLLAGVVGTSIGLVKARAAMQLAVTRADEALIESRTAQRTADFLTSVLSSADPTVSRGREVTVREAMDDAAALLDVELQDEPEVALRSRITLCKTYLSLAQTDKAREQAEKACELAERTAGKDSLSFARALGARAATARAVKKLPESVEWSREVLARFQGLLAPDDTQVAKAKIALADALMFAWKHDEAAELLREARSVLSAKGDSATVQCTTMLAAILSRRTTAASDTGQGAEALAMLGDELVAARAKGQAGELDVAAILASRAELRRRGRDFAGADQDCRESVAIRERIYPALHPRVVMGYGTIASNLRFQGRTREARELLTPLMQRLREAGRVTDYAFATMATELALANSLEGNASEAVGLYREALEIYRRANNRVMQAVVLAGLGDDLLVLEEFVEAERTLREAIEVSGGMAHMSASAPTVLQSLAGALEGQKRYAESAELLAKAEELAAGAGGDPPLILAIMLKRWSVLVAGGLEKEAGEQHARAAAFARANGMQGALEHSERSGDGERP